ncbi:hypothetical protein SDC9_177922 [bioreactor metagenome]|uniref:Uncharacterized protein n=1 Tax=bioreactor metagenome TaxID=1076179 RepID=A0A645GUC0_9ZZZZ
MRRLGEGGLRRAGDKKRKQREDHDFSAEFHPVSSLFCGLSFIILLFYDKCSIKTIKSNIIMYMQLMKA